jgi:Ca-activated chloride channel family protein
MDAIKFQHPEYLFALCGLVLLFALFMVSMRWRKRVLRSFADTSLVTRLHPESAAGRRWTKWMLAALAFGCIVMAWSNPLIGKPREKQLRKGVDVVIALDISNSMLAEDLKPSRLERARQFVIRLIDQMQDDRVGLIYFAGRAYRQLPFTSDRDLVKMFVRNVSTDLAPSQGTAISEAISLTMTSFSTEEKKPMALVVISDGEDHEAGATELARQAAASRISVFTIGIGTPRGAPIPQYVQDQMVGYKADRSGNIVLSKLNERALGEIARAGGGTYMSFNGSPEQVKELRDRIGEIEGTEQAGLRYDDYATWYQLPLGLALVLLLAEVLIVETRRNWMARIRVIGKARPVARLLPFAMGPFILTFLSQPAQAQSERKLVREGNRYYQREEFVKAEEAYAEALQAKPDYFKGSFNQGNALYMIGDHDSARTVFERAATLAPDKETRAASFYNMGNSSMAQKQWAQAIDAYKNCLKLDPTDDNARYNLAYAQKMLNRQSQQQQPDSRQDENQQEQQERPESQPDQQSLSPEQMEQLLKSLEQQEQKVQEKMQKQRVPVQPRRSEKDW